MKQQTLWTEDDCTRGLPGHEYVNAAWKRIFGTTYNPEQAINVIDHGDCTERQFPGGISVWNVYGAWNEIRQAEREAAL